MRSVLAKGGLTVTSMVMAEALIGVRRWLGRRRRPL